MTFKNRTEVIARWREIVGIADELCKLEAVDAFMEAVVVDGHGHIAEEIIDSLPANADRAHVLTCYLEELLHHGRLDRARSAINLASEEDELLELALLVAGHTGAPDDFAEVRALLAEGGHRPVCRAEFFTALFQLTKEPRDLKSAREEASRAELGIQRVGALGAVAGASRAEMDLAKLCAAVGEDGFMVAFDALLSWRIIPQALRAAEQFKNAAHRRVALAAIRAADPRRPRQFTN